MVLPFSCLQWAGKRFKDSLLLQLIGKPCTPAFQLFGKQDGGEGMQPTPLRGRRKEKSKGSRRRGFRVLVSHYGGYKLIARGAPQHTIAVLQKHQKLERKEERMSPSSMGA